MTRFVVIISAACADKAHHLRTYTLDAATYPQAQTFAAAKLRQEFGCVNVRIISTEEVQ
jgi:hypothetical protein